jgi:hypothetical protein
MRKFGLQNKEARSILEKLIEDLFVSFSMSEEQIYTIVNDVMRISVLEEGIADEVE